MLHDVLKGLALTVFGNCPSGGSPQLLLRHREPHKSLTLSLLGQIRDPLCGDHTRHHAIVWGDG
ncbi:hypothetical protein SAMN05428984_4009 [Sphingomonas sp. OK281]|nr:hypothetical protein [Sphingomonas sp. OK281]SFO41178.1 hypothetical protein SAMN05428984_4009 [Sphingomonas sp. OK281]